MVSPRVLVCERNARPAGPGRSFHALAQAVIHGFERGAPGRKRSDNQTAERNNTPLEQLPRGAAKMHDRRGATENESAMYHVPSAKGGVGGSSRARGGTCGALALVRGRLDWRSRVLPLGARVPGGRGPERLVLHERAMRGLATAGNTSGGAGSKGRRCWPNLQGKLQLMCDLQADLKQRATG